MSFLVGPAEGHQLGGLVGEETTVAGPGAWALKPRGILHTMWNSEATPPASSRC